MGKHHSEGEILRVLRDTEAGTTDAEICFKHSISRGCLPLWKKKRAELESKELPELRNLRMENVKLRELVANLSLERQLLKEMLAKKF